MRQEGGGKIMSVIIFCVTLAMMYLMDVAINEIAKEIQEKFPKKERGKIFGIELGVFFTLNFRLLIFLSNNDINQFPAIPNACYYAVLCIFAYNTIDSFLKAVKLFVTDTIECLR